jgi:hypothetical protein
MTDQEKHQPGQPSVKKSRWKRRLMISAVCFAIVYGFRAPLFTAYAGLLTVPMASNVDVSAVVLGDSPGGMAAIMEAALLYQSGQVEQILILAESPTRLHQMGIVTPFESIAKQELVTAGVPESAIRIHDHRQALHAWLKLHSTSHVAIFVSEFAAQKELLDARREFGPDCASRIHCRPISDRRFDASNWWLHKQGVLTVFNETIALTYHLLADTGEAQQSACETDCRQEWDLDPYERQLRLTTVVKQ